MRIIEKDNNIIIEQVVDFDIEQILECGQCFHFEKLDNKEYVIIAFSKLLHIRQTNDKVVLYKTSMDEYNNVWKQYFDMDRDYSLIKDALIKKDDKLKDSISSMNGIRILNQDFFEMLISFIISQNKQIPHIKQLVFAISKEYGIYIGNVGEKEYYTFPQPEVLKKLTIEDWKALKTGFRAPYLYDAVDKIFTKAIDRELLDTLTTEEMRNVLMNIKGVGEKVANCVILFSLGRREAFPIDVWMKRIMENIYFGKETSKTEIEKLAKELYGEYGGYAQQYLFHYGRSVKMGKNEKKREKTSK